MIIAAFILATTFGADTVREDLKIPPVPAIPGAPVPVKDDATAEPKVIPLTPEEVAALEVEAAASPRRSNFTDQRGAAQPQVPPASVRRRQEIHLHPIEEMVADRSAMSDSLRVMRADLRLPTNFTTVYEVEQRPDVLVRGNGAVYAVFPQGDYALAYNRKRKPFVQTLIPAGTMFYIGEPNWRRVWLPGIRGMMPKLRLMTAEEWAALEAPASARERVEPTMPRDYDGVYLEPIYVEDLPGMGLIDQRIDTFLAPAARAFGAAPTPLMTRRSSDEEVSHPLLGDAANALSNKVEPQFAAPPIHTNAAYRQERLNALLGRAARQPTP